jgi:response regulator RpfG family c-di-GMP phosphodiesterase
MSDSNLARGVVLCVDDEPNILSSLSRLFAVQRYECHTADSGAAALAVLEQVPVDVLICDMRMPQMSGADLLEEVAQRYPQTVRVLLTGYADAESAIEAVNRGRIFSFIRKPWEEGQLEECVRQGLLVRQLERDKAELLALTQRQNEELERKVTERTAELNEALALNRQAYRKLERGYMDAIPVLANLVDMAEDGGLSHARRMADQARDFVTYLGLPEQKVEDVYLAALLHDVGKIGLPERVLSVPAEALSPADRQILQTHPARGAAALAGLEPLEAVAALIRSHHERYDGRGYPDQLAGDDIPIGSRVLAVLDEFDELQQGLIFPERYSERRTAQFLLQQSGRRYDGRVVKAFLKWWQTTRPSAAPDVDDGARAASALREGMVLTRDLQTHDGMLLMPKGRALTAKFIEKLRQIERESQQPLRVYAS